MYKLKRSFFFFVLLAALVILGLVFILSIAFLPQFFLLIAALYVFLFFFLIGFFKKIRARLLHLQLNKEKALEAFNISEQEMARLSELRVSLEKKIRGYQRLERFTERLNHETSLDAICDIVVLELFELFEGRGNVLLYLVDPRTHKLEVRAVKKEDASLGIPEKSGDLFDHWVLRHNQPLLVEAAASDFRFDPEKVKAQIQRPVESLMAVPLESVAQTLGILRIDARSLREYSSDDLRLLAVIGDIARFAIENAVYFRQMQELSITDGLTGIALRRCGVDRLREEFLRAQHDASSLSFLMVDIDHFKSVNDTYGHMAGDAVLKKIARLLKDFFDFPGQLVFRYGGEEFGVILPAVLKKEARALAESFRKSLYDKDINLRREKIGARVSVGLSSYPGDAADYKELIQKADEALLEAKRTGRDRVCTF